MPRLGFETDDTTVRICDFDRCRFFAWYELWGFGSERGGWDDTGGCRCGRGNVGINRRGTVGRKARRRAVARRDRHRRWNL